MRKLNEVLEMLKEQPRLVNCVSPMTFGEISEAFRIMNQRLEAAEEARVDIAEGFRELEQEAQKNLEGAFAWQQRAEAAEAKLAGADKQPRPDYFLNRIESSDKWGQEVELRIYESQLDASKSQEDHGGAIIELFTAPVPPQ